MNPLKPRSISVRVLLLSLVCAVSLKLGESTFMPACMNKFLVLPCQSKSPSDEHLWRYKEHINWRDIGSFSMGKSYLSPNIPGKFKGVTNIFVNGSLTFSSFLPELSGIYDCQSYTEGQLRHSMVKAVAVKCVKKVCEGDDAIVECDLMKYKNLLYLKQLRKIVWKKEKTILVTMGPNMNVTYKDCTYSDIEAIQGIGALKIGPASNAVNGQRYTCVVYGEIGITPRRYSVVVNVQKCQKTKSEACEGESIDMRCPDYLPLATNTSDIRLEWYNGSNMIARLRKHQGHTTISEPSLVKVNETNGVVTLVSPRIFHNGLYTCKVFRERELLAKHSVTLNVTQCLNQTGYQNSRKLVAKSKCLNEKSTAKPAADVEAQSKARNTSPFPYGLLMVFVLPLCLICLFIKRRFNY